MKKPVSILMAILFASVITSCGGGGEEKEMVKLPDPPTDLKYTVEGELSVENNKVADPIGNWTGEFGNNSIVLVIEDNSNGIATGYNIVKDNRRAISGTCSAEGDKFVLILNEPGDHKWDGVFTFEISNDDQHAVGSWNMNGDDHNDQTLFDLVKEQQEETAVTSNSNIEGELSAYMSAVPGEYLFEMEKREDAWVPGYNESIKIKFNFHTPTDIKSGTGYNHYGPRINAKVLDENGEPLQFSLSNSSSDLAEMLKNGAGEEWLTLSVSGQGSIMKTEDAVKLLEKYNSGKIISFDSEIIAEEFDEDEDEDVVSSGGNDASASGDCDQFLKDYEAFMSDYVKLLKKYTKNPTDMTLMSEYTSMVSKAAQWSGDAADCSSDTAFAKKIANIQLKMANAAAGM
jgi:hypothetical protein